MEQFLLQNKEFIAVLIKILGAIIGAGLFVKFTYSFSVKYFEALSKDVARMKCLLWGPDGRPDKGIEHRLTELENDHRNQVCKTRRKK